MFYEVDVPAHPLTTATANIHKLHSESGHCSMSSPDLVPSDFHLFLKLKFVGIIFVFTISLEPFERASYLVSLAPLSSSNNLSSNCVSLFLLARTTLLRIKFFHWASWKHKHGVGGNFHFHLFFNNSLSYSSSLTNREYCSRLSKRSEQKSHDKVSN